VHRSERLFSRAIWLTFWVVLTYLAMRLVHIITADRCLAAVPQ
jgi:hypothetical protein